MNARLLVSLLVKHPAQLQIRNAKNNRRIVNRLCQQSLALFSGQAIAVCRKEKGL